MPGKLRKDKRYGRGRALGSELRQKLRGACVLARLKRDVPGKITRKVFVRNRLQEEPRGDAAERLADILAPGAPK